MTRASDDVAGMLAFVPWALAHPGATVTEAAATFGVSEATIHRWVGTLNFCGLPGLGGGDLIEADIFGDEISVHMADELKAPMRLTDAEALLLILAGEAALAALGSGADDLRSALDKVRDAAGISATTTVQFADEGAIWRDALRSAITHNRVVRFRYHRRGDDEVTDRQVDPWQILVRDGQWYLQAYDHDRDDARTFRLDRITDLEVTETDRTHPAPQKGMPDPIYQPGEDDLKVELHLAPHARWIAEAVEPTEVEEVGDGALRVVLHTSATAWLRRLLLSAGAGARVVAPRELADEVRSIARRAADRYETS